jgi:hypothetical protein
MFDKTNFEELGKDIYVYKNFISEKECTDIINAIESHPEDMWKPSNLILGNKGNMVLDTEIKKIKIIQNRLRKLLDQGVYLGPSLQCTRMLKGSTWSVHSDNSYYLDVDTANKKLKKEQDFKLVLNQIFGTVMYFNSFKGGEIFYPNQNITYFPNPGDLLIHSAKEHCSHGVAELKSKVRYTHSNNLCTYVKVPKEYNGF